MLAILGNKSEEVLWEDNEFGSNMLSPRGAVLWTVVDMNLELRRRVKTGDKNVETMETQVS